jgi:hypothetical protein
MFSRSRLMAKQRGLGPDPSPWFPGGLVAELVEILGRRVQIVTEPGLDDLLRDHPVVS